MHISVRKVYYNKNDKIDLSSHDYKAKRKVFLFKWLDNMKMKYRTILLHVS